jgi:hypothetical protein
VHYPIVAVASGPFQRNQGGGFEDALQRQEQAVFQGELIALLGQGDDVGQERFGGVRELRQDSHKNRNTKVRTRAPV